MRSEYFCSFSRACVTWLSVCVAISENLIKVSCGATAGDTTGFTNTPSCRSSLVMAKVRKLSRMYSGIIGVDVLPISNPIERKPSRAMFVSFHKCS